MTLSGEDDAVRVEWGEGENAHALTFERLDEETWSRREWTKDSGQWRIVGTETVGRVVVENARQVVGDG